MIIGTRRGVRQDWPIYDRPPVDLSKVGLAVGGTCPPSAPLTRLPGGGYSCVEGPAYDAVPIGWSLMKDGSSRPMYQRPEALGEPSALSYAWTAASIAGTALGAYHGYKRSGGSLGWAFLWALMGGLAPVVTVPVAIAQGFGRRA